MRSYKMNMVCKVCVRVIVVHMVISMRKLLDCFIGMPIYMFVL